MTNVSIIKAKHNNIVHTHHKALKKALSESPFFFSNFYPGIAVHYTMTRPSEENVSIEEMKAKHVGGLQKSKIQMSRKTQHWPRALNSAITIPQKASGSIELLRSWMPGKVSARQGRDSVGATIGFTMEVVAFRGHSIL